jgi:hypothetical protein
MADLLCEICGPRARPIAKFDPEELSIPLKGSMFHSIDPDRGCPAPFHPNLDWEHMRCPQCHFRPFKHQDKVLTPNGYVQVQQEDPEPPVKRRTKTSKGEPVDQEAP